MHDGLKHEPTMHVVIIGGGAVGSSVAYHLAVHPRFAGRITVIERDPTYARASSSLSAGGIRQQFSTPVNIAMSAFGLAFLRAAPSALAVDGDAPDLAFREAGYLFLASPAGLPVLHENRAVQMAAGADIALLEPGELAARFPWLSTEGVAAGSLGLSGEGSFDGPGLLAALRRKARALGVTYVAAAAAGLEQDAGRITAVRLEDDATIPCDVAVDAAGPWSAAIAGWAGIDLPIRPRRRMIFVLACRETLPGCPLTIDPSGIWFRAEGAHFLTGRSPGPDEDDPDEPPLAVDEAVFTDAIWPVIAARVPAFEAVRVVSSWAGYYEVNTFDHNGIIGPHPSVPNLIFATGFSGHGIQHAPATGRGVAEWIVEGGYRTLDLSPLGIERLIAGKPLLERNVV